MDKEELVCWVDRRLLLGATEGLYRFLFLLETVGHETPPSNLCVHIDSKVPWSPNGGKRPASMGLPQGAASHSQASPTSAGDKGKLDTTTTIPCKFLLINELHEPYWMRYNVNKNSYVDYYFWLRDSKLFKIEKVR